MPCVIFAFEIYYMNSVVSCLIIGFDKKSATSRIKVQGTNKYMRRMHCCATLTARSSGSVRRLNQSLYLYCTS